MNQTILAGAFGLSGVVLGWLLNHAATLIQARPRFCFKMHATSNTELIDRELHTKFGPSDCGVEIYNLGRNPVVLDAFEILYKRNVLIDNCSFYGSEQTVLPYQSVIYTFNDQELDRLMYNCEEHEMDKCASCRTHQQIQCKVVLSSVDGKKYSGKLDITWLILQIRASAQFP